MWVMGTKLGSFIRAASVFEFCVISPVPLFPFEDCTLISYMLIWHGLHFFPIKGSKKYTALSNLSVLCIVNKACLIGFNLNGGFHSYSVRLTADRHKFKASLSAGWDSDQPVLHSESLSEKKIKELQNFSPVKWMFNNLWSKPLPLYEMEVWALQKDILMYKAMLLTKLHYSKSMYL